MISSSTNFAVLGANSTACGLGGNSCEAILVTANSMFSASIPPGKSGVTLSGPGWAATIGIPLISREIILYAQ